MFKKELKDLTSDLKNYLKETDEADLPVFDETNSEQTAITPIPADENGNGRAVSETKQSSQTQQMFGLPDELPDNLDELKKIVSLCRKCPLGETRLNAVFGVGNPDARIMFVGEGPGFDEDHQGEPFVGKAGKLLDKIIAAMGFKRGDVYIANIVKCHAMINPDDPEKRGNDRPPAPDEFSACRDYLEKQISIIKPDFIVALGAVSARVLLDVNVSLGSLRGVFHSYPEHLQGLAEQPKIIVTYHPAALLRNPHWKAPCWEDMKMLLTEMSIPIPKFKINK